MTDRTNPSAEHPCSRCGHPEPSHDGSTREHSGCHNCGCPVYTTATESATPSAKAPNPPRKCGGCGCEECYGRSSQSCGSLQRQLGAWAQEHLHVWLKEHVETARKEERERLGQPPAAPLARPCPACSAPLVAIRDLSECECGWRDMKPPATQRDEHIAYLITAKHSETARADRAEGEARRLRGFLDRIRALPPDHVAHLPWSSFHELLQVVKEYTEQTKSSESTRPPASALEGHDEPCAFCEGMCDCLSADPGLWPLGFSHPDSTGVCRWHHTSCVQKRLFDNALVK